MNLRAVLVAVVVVDVVLSVASSVIHATGLSALTYLTVVGGDEPMLPDSVRMLMGVLFLASVLVGWIGILRLWGPARFFYIGAWLLALIQYATTRARVEPGWSYCLFALTGLSGGFLICLVFCSELRREFGGERP